MNNSMYVPVETFERLVDVWKDIAIKLEVIWRHYPKLTREEQRLYRMARDMEHRIAICDFDKYYRDRFTICDYGESRYISKHIIELWKNVQQYDQHVD